MEDRLKDDIAAVVVKQATLAAGPDPTEFSAHSLRAGFITSAVDAGADVHSIMRVSRHKTVDVLVGYVRRWSDFEGHAGASFL
jgi:site-specific recombinase XerD